MQMNENSTADSLSENYLIYPSMKFYFLNLLTLASPANTITTWTIDFMALMCIAQRVASAPHGVNAQPLHTLPILFA